MAVFGREGNGNIQPVELSCLPLVRFWCDNDGKRIDFKTWFIDTESVTDLQF